ncbi:MAG: hypothetical protein JXQ71_17505 [Verrucomicrobia bacterium]|nr:hypothetical protein [Verrucomicrobiota bacterium]
MRRRVRRLCVRGVVRGGGVLVAGLVLLAAWLQGVGIPECITAPHVAALRQRGWDVQFGRLRWQWHHGLVADNLQIQHTGARDGPRLFLEHASCLLSPRALGRLALVPRTLRISGGRLVWTVERPPRPRRFMDWRGLDGDLVFNPDDTWQLRSLRATYRTLRVRASGTVRHASALRDRPLPPSFRTEPDTLQRWLDRIESVAAQVAPGDIPEIEVVAHADARALHKFHASMELHAPGFDSPWGRAAHCLLSARLRTGPAIHDPPQAELHLAAEQAHTPWAQARRVVVTAQFAPSWTNPAPDDARIDVQLDAPRTPLLQARQLRLHLHSRIPATNAATRLTDFQLTAAGPSATWAATSNLLLTGQWMHPAGAWLPAWGSALGTGDGLRTPWGDADGLHLRATGTLASVAALVRTNLPWHERCAALAFAMNGMLTNTRTAKGHIDRLNVATRWETPRLSLDIRTAETEAADATLNLDTATRELRFRVASVLSPAGVAPWLGTNAPSWLATLSCRAPPRIQAGGRLVLPDWNLPRPDWRRGVLPTVEATARMALGEAGFQGFQIAGLSTSLALTNGRLSVPDLVLRRAEGGLNAAGELDWPTGEFQATVQSRIDLHAARAFVRHPKAQRIFDLVQWPQPPRIQARLRGNLDNRDRWAASGEVALGPFTVRGEGADECAARLVYTNRFLSVLSPRLRRGEEQATADGLGFDLRRGRERLFVTNATGRLDPYALLRAINTNTARIVSRYAFATPPRITARGIVGLRSGDRAEDLHLDLAGGPFHWHVFNLRHIAGHVHVLNRSARLTKVRGEFYGGTIAGNALFDWAAGSGTDASFMATVQDSNLGRLMADISRKPNRLDGTLSGYVHIDRAHSKDPLSWQGYGALSLTNGLIWDFPVFGVVSRMLNTITPGLGNSRAREALMDYSITNSVIYTRDIDIRATGMRVHFDGTIGFDQALNARVEAELLRDLPALGFLVSKAFWPLTRLFVLKVTGTWSQPQTQPLYILPNLVSKLVVVPFRPWSTLKNLFNLEPIEPGTNAPAPPPP